MVSATKPTANSPTDPVPAWDIARLFPNQGDWTEEEYLYLSEMTNRRVELAGGHVEIPEMPGLRHQRIVQKLLAAIQAVVPSRAVGEVVLGSYPLKLAERTFREPDVLFVRAENLARMHDRFSEVADLVVEVVSQDRKTDLVVKREEYAAAGIPEYWIIDPAGARVIVLRLQGATYVEHGSWTTDGVATSLVLPELRIQVSALFA